MKIKVVEKDETEFLPNDNTRGVSFQNAPERGIIVSLGPVTLYIRVSELRGLGYNLVKKPKETSC